MVRTFAFVSITFSFPSTLSQYIIRHRITCTTPNGKGAKMHTLTTHFMSDLCDKGLKAVQSWTAKKDINMFHKGTVFFSYQRKSSLVIANCNQSRQYRNELLGCASRQWRRGSVSKLCVYSHKLEHHSFSTIISLLHLDLVGVRDSAQYQILLRSWLNSEWKLLGRDKIGRANRSPCLTRTKMCLVEPNGK